MSRTIRLLAIVLLSLFIALPAVLPAQKAKVNHRKIEKEQKKRERAGMRDYRDALKRHHKRQSKETRAMMKQSRKQAKKTLPVGRK